MERELHLFARLVDAPLHRGQGDLERLGDLRVREPDDVSQKQRHLQIGVEILDRAPHCVDRLGTLSWRVDDFERRRIFDVHDGARPALDRTELVQHPVLRDLEEPRREPRAERKARKPLEDAQEDLLRQVLGEAAITSQTQDVVVNRLLVRADDDREGTLVAPLGLSQNAEVWLWQRHVREEYRDLFVKASDAGSYGAVVSGTPVISEGTGMPSCVKIVGARSDNSPSSWISSRSSVTTSGTRFVVWAVCGLTPSASSITSAFPWSAVTKHTPSTARTQSSTRPSAASVASTAATTAGIDLVWPTMSGFAKFTTQNA